MKLYHELHGLATVAHVTHSFVLLHLITYLLYITYLRQQPVCELGHLRLHALEEHLVSIAATSSAGQ